MQVSYLANQMPWFGAHTGYERLPNFVESQHSEADIIIPRKSVPHLVLGKLVSLTRGHGRISQSNAAARFRLELALRLHPRRLGHLLYAEEHFLYWRDVGPSLLERTVLTLHQPRATWKDEYTQGLSVYRHIIVLWQKDQAWFQSHLPNGKVHFIHHGVDTEFFTPLPADTCEAPPRPKRVLYAGVHLRNTPMLARVISQLDKLHPELYFDLLVPLARRSDPALVELQHHPRITWHANLNDEQLRDLYRNAHVLLLPMNDSGANTAVIEALACGLPIVTTDVGGIRDYGGDSVYPIVKNDDDAAMVALMDDYLSQPAWRDEVAARCRSFAETTLAWPAIAQKHVAVYREIAP